MATRSWLGNAAPVAQQTTITVANTWAADDTATITINTKDITFTVVSGATAIADVVAGIVAAWNASTLGECQEITAEDQSPNVLLIHDTPGVPFTVTASENTDGDGTFGSVTNTVEATGPWHFDNPDNWSGNTVPVDNDTIVFDTGNVPLKYALNQSSVSPAAIKVEMGYTGTIGLPLVNNDNAAAPYREYRDTYLKLGDSGDSIANTITIGDGSGTGSGRIKIDTNTAQTTLNVNNTGQAAEDGIPAVLWKGTHASNVANINKGSVGIAIFAGESATVATVNIGYRENQAGDVNLRCGSGVTLTTVTQNGGIVTLDGNVTTTTVTSGELVYQNGAMTTLNLDRGAVRYRSAGTLTTANVGSGGNLDFRQNPRGRTVTNLLLYEGSEYHDPAGTVTLTNGADFYRCTPAEVIFDVVPHRTWTPSTI